LALEEAPSNPLFPFLDLFEQRRFYNRFDDNVSSKYTNSALQFELDKRFRDHMSQRFKEQQQYDDAKRRTSPTSSNPPTFSGPAR
jgi:hypothetical protein